MGRALVAAGLAVLVAAGLVTVWALYLTVLILVTGETVVDTSAQALLPSLVERADLDSANGRLFATQTVAHRFLGPPLGGFMYAASIALPVAVDAITFLLAALVMLGLAGRFGAERVESPQESIRASTASGLRWLWRNRPIRAFAIGAAVLNVGLMAGEGILVLFAQDQLGLSGVGFGALLAAVALGYTFGSLGTPRFVGLASRLSLVIACVATVGTGLVVTGAAPNWPIAIAGMLSVGVATGIWDVIAVSFRQAAVPDELLGRVMAAYRFVAYGSFPIGALLGGVVASVAGNRAAFATGSGLVLLLIPFLLKALRGFELDPRRVSR